MTVNANTPCRFTRGLNHGCKTFEFTKIARSMRSRTRNFFLHFDSVITINRRSLAPPTLPDVLVTGR